MLVLLFAASLAAAPLDTRTIHLDLKLRSGGTIGGLVVDHDDHALVIVHEQSPYVFSWKELEFPSALAARRGILALARGGEKHLTAEDHFQLGVFALGLERNDVAAYEFRQAQRLDRKVASQVEQALDDFRRRRQTPTDDPFDADPEPPETPPDPDSPAPPRDLPVLDDTALASPQSEQTREKILAAYQQFGGKVREVLGKDVQPLESPHFLIWTDWEPRYRERLIEWSEAMYAALCRQFDLSPADSVFLAKCPMFCFRSKAKFQKFARHFDGYDGVSAAGYTRSIERNGHVHVVLLRQGKEEIDFERFAGTLVHEGTHAFVHRLFSHRLIPHWINEGLAELTAERVLGDSCDTAETASLLARQFACYGWELGGLLETTGPIGVHQYPLAHGVVAYLEGLGRERFIAFLRTLKAGKSTAEGLAEVYDGLTPSRLEVDWRNAASENDTKPPTPPTPQ